MSNDRLLLTTQFKKGSRFGIIKVKVKNNEELNYKSQHFILNVDRSGSMTCREKDGMTKMEHVIHTIKNMLRYFVFDMPNGEIYISVLAFDNIVDCIVDKELVNENNIGDLIKRIESIYPRNTTDIGAAITSANEQKQNFLNSANNKYVEQTHILLTDGMPTNGITGAEPLCNLVDNSMRNIFIGYGIDHNMQLMKQLAEYEKGDYYFVECAENAGNVYGEIIHKILYEVMSQTSISIQNASIYDWKVNTWNKELNIGVLSNNAEKVFHINLDEKDEEYKRLFMLMKMVN